MRERDAWSRIVGPESGKADLRADICGDVFVSCSDLEQAVESLSELLERPLEEDKIAELRQQTTDKTVYVAKRCKILLDDTLRGYEEDRWIWQEPIRL